MKPAQPPVQSQVAQAAQPKSDDIHPRPHQESPTGRVPINSDPFAKPVRIDVGRLVKMVLYSLVLPMGLAIALDFLLGFFPLFTIAAVVLVFPIAGFLVMRTALREMKSVINQVAPEEPDEEAGAEPAGVNTEINSETE